MICGETGAFRASAISCAFALMLPFRTLMVRMASLRLFCRRCLDLFVFQSIHPRLPSFRVCHPLCATCPFAGSAGPSRSALASVGVRSCRYVGNFSIGEPLFNTVSPALVFCELAML